MEKNQLLINNTAVIELGDTGEVVSWEGLDPSLYRVVKILKNFEDKKEGIGKNKYLAIAIEEGEWDVLHTATSKEGLYVGLGPTPTELRRVEEEIKTNDHERSKEMVETNWNGVAKAVEKINPFSFNFNNDFRFLKDFFSKFLNLLKQRFS